MANCYTKSQIPQLKERTIFFDANILIYLFAPTGRGPFERKYASIFAGLLKEKCKMAVDFTILSEFINRAIRTNYEIYLKSNNLDKKILSFKQYRNNVDGQMALQAIYDMVNNKIMKYFEVIGKSFTMLDIQSMLRVDSLDFNDKAIELICRENNFILITNDVDYKDTSLDILTVNNQLKL